MTKTTTENPVEWKVGSTISVKEGIHFKQRCALVKNYGTIVTKSKIVTK